MCICAYINHRLFYVTGVPSIVPYITISDVPYILSWIEPFNNLDPIVNYTVSCSGDVTCPPNFTTTDNTTRSYTITNLTPMTNYVFLVVATNSIGTGLGGALMITTPSGEHHTGHVPVAGWYMLGFLFAFNYKVGVCVGYHVHTYVIIAPVK